MSACPPAATPNGPRPRPPWRRPGAAVAAAARRPGQVAWLWLVWMLLWGRLSVLAALSGLLVAVAVPAAFPSPPPEAAPGRPPPRPAAPGWLAVRLLAGLLPASITVAAQVFRYGPAMPSVIVAVPLRTRSEVIAVLVADAVSLAPGSAVIQVDRENGVFYVHALVAPGPGAVETVRAHADALQRRVILALGHDLVPPRPPPAGGAGATGRQ
ncbi:Na+/H+ antiporter subunit E [Pseudofrankia sp. BMG5.37]|uniref:Na+/H+ antiporter subunit E n=1 Tax=Pseudofrankia sp. BMG5.37 TaxID=3050035 RepID=UPI002895DFE7|nr:Na+/H+ antiporter subunit E [Pseudofrankia sp. BMG5.37]MDT3445897.1 Na+/H+ antiporter subunit E [Pseudofrankia sp. BMG5.37]